MNKNKKGLRVIIEIFAWIDVRVHGRQHIVRNPSDVCKSDFFLVRTRSCLSYPNEYDD